MAVEQPGALAVKVAVAVAVPGAYLLWRRWGRRFDCVTPVLRAKDDELDRVAFTSRWVAAERAFESGRPDALFDDPFADALGCASGRTFSDKMRWTFAKSVGWAEYHITWVAIRTRAIDDAIARFAAAHPTFQLVNLGAGLDARGYRLDALHGKCRAFFEVDQRQVVDAKRKWALTAPVLVAAVCPLVHVAADFRDAAFDLRRALLVHGFDPDVPTFWLLEGLTMYLSVAANRGLLEAISGASLGPAQLCAGLICEPFNEASSSSSRPSSWFFRKKHRPFYHATADEFTALLKDLGWANARVAVYGDADLNFGRYPKNRKPDKSQCICFASH